MSQLSSVSLRWWRARVRFRTRAVVGHSSRWLPPAIVAGAMSDRQSRSGPDWETLQRSLSGLVVLPGSVAYERARPPFIAWFDDLQPQAVVSCAAAGEVAQALAFARRYGLAVAVRRGGHCFAGFSSTPGL